MSGYSCGLGKKLLSFDERTLKVAHGCFPSIQLGCQSQRIEQRKVDLRHSAK